MTSRSKKPLSKYGKSSSRIRTPDPPPPTSVVHPLNEAKITTTPTTTSVTATATSSASKTKSAVKPDDVPKPVKTPSKSPKHAFIRMMSKQSIQERLSVSTGRDRDPRQTTRESKHQQHRRNHSPASPSGSASMHWRRKVDRSDSDQSLSFSYDSISSMSSSYSHSTSNPSLRDDNTKQEYQMTSQYRNRLLAQFGIPKQCPKEISIDLWSRYEQCHWAFIDSFRETEAKVGIGSMSGRFNPTNHKAETLEQSPMPKIKFIPFMQRLIRQTLSREQRLSYDAYVDDKNRRPTAGVILLTVPPELNRWCACMILPPKVTTAHVPRWTFPRGKSEVKYVDTVTGKSEYESAEETAIRECAQEVGYDELTVDILRHAQDFQIERTEYAPGSFIRLFLVRVRHDFKFQTRTSGEVAEIRWIHVDESVDMANLSAMAISCWPHLLRYVQGLAVPSPAQPKPS